MGDGLPYRTRLAALLASTHQTHEEAVAAFNERARQLRESATLSVRQLDRWLSGRLTRLPRPTACRVAQSLWGEPIQHLLAPPPVSHSAARPIAAADTMVPSAKPPPDPPAADPELVSHWHKLLGVLAISENLFGPQRLTGTVTRELAVIRATRQAARDPLRTAFVQLEARWTEFLGWLADNAHDEPAGQYWTDRALELSLEAGDQLMTGYVLMRKSQQAIVRGDAPSAIALATTAGRQPATSPAVAALAAVRQAEGHALDQDEAACRRSLDQAHDLAAHAAQDPDAPWDGDLGRHCTPAYVRAHEAHCWLRLRQPGRAISLLEQLLPTWPSPYRQDEALHRSRLAQAYAAAGEADQAVLHGSRALATTDSGSAYRVHAELLRLDRQLAATNRPRGLDLPRTPGGHQPGDAGGPPLP
jgi:tetratricopeptide (TPR) repeat protein